jgi:hypothetical protein
MRGGYGEGYCQGIMCMRWICRVLLVHGLTVKAISK